MQESAYAETFFACKMEKVIEHICTPIAMPPNFMRIRGVKGFKCALEFYASIIGHLNMKHSKALLILFYQIQKFQRFSSYF